MSSADNWKEVLNAHLEGSRERIRKAGLMDEEIVDRAKVYIRQQDGYFTTVEPVCYLSSMTTRNVVIRNKRLSGVTGIHSIAFGDPLMPIGLTKIRLLAKGYDTEYTEYWAKGLNLTYDQQLAIQSYTILYCVKLLSKIGNTPQQDQTDEITEADIHFLKGIFDNLLKG